MAYRQLILFGSPGVGKSHLVRATILPELGVDAGSENCIGTVFHPEYGYGDFMGKLLPMTRGGTVEYRYYAGHFLQALALAYRNLRLNEAAPAGVALVIDELNRGNSAAIFGTAFQLLDREPDGWSSYAITLSEMEHEKLLELMDFTPVVSHHGGFPRREFQYGGRSVPDLDGELRATRIEGRKVKIPPNLSIIATINTSDTSIYYMDAAFKRRWEWEFVDLQSKLISSDETAFADQKSWKAFVDKLNEFIRRNGASVRHIEDKQIGYWFLSKPQVLRRDVQNKLLFFLWDSVFARDRKPLCDLLSLRRDQLVTFGDLASRDQLFVAKISALETEPQ